MSGFVCACAAALVGGAPRAPPAPRLPYVVLLLLAVNPALTGYTRSSAEETYQAPPSFDPGQPTHLLAVLGQPVLLPCTMYNLADKLVSWVRTRDLNILTHGTATFTADPRFDIQHGAGSDTWTLKIGAARLNDTGRYECQVNTDPKMSLFFNLRVQEHATGRLRASVSGPREQHVGAGSTVTLLCEVAPELADDALRPSSPAPHVQWLHDGLALSFQAERGGISMDSERSGQRISSRLIMAGVGPSDEGRYTCVAGDAHDAVTLHVVQEGEDYGEHMEAMQRDQAGNVAAQRAGCAVALVVSLLLHGANFWLLAREGAYIKMT